ncbi:MAG: hypothetical protein WA918_07400 [Erythrobacter sp.]
MPDTAVAGRPRIQRTLGALALLTMGVPLTLALMAGAMTSRPHVAPKRHQGKSAANRDRYTILISGAKMTKALVLARAFHAAGHRVLLCESARYEINAHRFSHAVDSFHVLPDSGAPGYGPALKRLIERECVDIYLPVTSPAGSLHDAALVPELSQLCEVLHAGPDLITLLDDKARFAETARAAGLRVPGTHRVTSADEALAFDFTAYNRPFILKSIAYDPVGRLDLVRLPMDDRAAMESYVRALPISEDNPYVLQEFIAGTEFCTHGFFRNGELRVHCACESSAFQVNYEHRDIPEIREWVEAFGRATGLTGQASFDYIRAADDGEYFAIECNPRTHSAITLFGGDARLAEAYLSREEAAPIEPLPGARPTFWSAHELWRILCAWPDLAAIRARLDVIARGRDAVFDAKDPLPFAALHHLHIPFLLIRSLAEGRQWHRIDFNIGKLVQDGGD